MTPEHLAAFRTFRAASLTMARLVSPRLGWCVRNADNDLRAPLSAQRKGAGFSPRPAPTISDPEHAAEIAQVRT